MLHEEDRCGPAAHTTPVLGGRMLTRCCLLSATCLLSISNSRFLPVIAQLHSSELAPSPCIALLSLARLSAGQHRLMCCRLSCRGADPLPCRVPALSLRHMLTASHPPCWSHSTTCCPSPCPRTSGSSLPRGSQAQTRPRSRSAAPRLGRLAAAEGSVRRSGQAMQQQRSRV